MKSLGIDWGEKRIGLSYADEVGVAVPIPAAVEGRKKDRLQHIGREIQNRRIDTLVVGYPINMDGSTGFKAREVDHFIKDLENRFHLPVHRVDERLTTHQVRSDLPPWHKSGRHQRKTRSSGDVDSRAATLILQDFISMNEEEIEGF